MPVIVPSPDAARPVRLPAGRLFISSRQACSVLIARLAAELLHWAGPQIAGTFRREDPRARTASVAWAGPGLMPAWLDQARELSEYWIHRQQILQGLGRPSDLRADLAGPVLDGLRWAYPYRLAQALAQPGDTVTITITGPVTKTWHLVAAESGWRFGDQPGTRLGYFEHGHAAFSGQPAAGHGKE